VVAVFQLTHPRVSLLLRTGLSTTPSKSLWLPRSAGTDTESDKIACQSGGELIQLGVSQVPIPSSYIDCEIRQLNNLSEDNRAQIMAWNSKTPKPFEKCEADGDQCAGTDTESDKIACQSGGELIQLGVSQVNNLSEDNRAQIMAWNSKTPKPFEKCAHHVVQEMAKKQMGISVPGPTPKVTR
jgi:hypothetical protein